MDVAQTLSILPLRLARLKGTLGGGGLFPDFTGERFESKRAQALPPPPHKESEMSRLQRKKNPM